MNQRQLLLERLLSSFRRAELDCDIEGDAVTVAMGDMRCRIETEKADYVATDGARIDHIVNVYNQCANPAPGMTELENIGRWNAFASMVSTVRDNRGVGATARIIVFEDREEVITNLYAPLLYCATWLSFGVSSFLAEGYPSAEDFLKHGVMSDMSPSRFGIPDAGVHESCRVSLDDMKAVESFADSRRMLSFADAGGVSVEFPWDRDAMGALFDLWFNTRATDGSDGGERPEEWKRTSLFMVQPNQMHPLLGSGVLLRLQVPIAVKAEDLPALVNDMNRWELQAADMPPFLGSWCMDPHFPSPAFTCFVPAMFSHLVKVQNLFSWTFGRHRAAMGYLRQRGAE